VAGLPAGAAPGVVVLRTCVSSFDMSRTTPIGGALERSKRSQGQGQRAKWQVSRKAEADVRTSERATEARRSEVSQAQTRRSKASSVEQSSDRRSGGELVAGNTGHPGHVRPVSPPRPADDC
jgi:hypothetical protein